jgi:hypothetical protein
MNKYFRTSDFYGGAAVAPREGWRIRTPTTDTEHFSPSCPLS